MGLDHPSQVREVSLALGLQRQVDYLALQDLHLHLLEEVCSEEALLHLPNQAMAYLETHLLVEDYLAISLVHLHRLKAVLINLQPHLLASEDKHKHKAALYSLEEPNSSKIPFSEMQTHL